MTTTQQHITIPPQIRDYLEGLLKDTGMEFLDEVMHENMLIDLFARLDSYITAVIIDSMPVEHLDEFVKLHEDNKPQAEIEQYIKDHLPEAKQVLTKAFVDFRDEYVGNVAVARNIPPAEAN